MCYSPSSPQPLSASPSHPHSSFYLQCLPWPPGPHILYQYSEAVSYRQLTLHLGFSFHTNGKVMGVIIPPIFPPHLVPFSTQATWPSLSSYFLPGILCLFLPQPQPPHFCHANSSSLSKQKLKQDSFTEAFLKGIHRLLYSTLTLVYFLLNTHHSDPSSSSV